MKIKPAIIALAVLIGAGCQSQNPGIVRLSTDTYMLSRKDYRGIYGNMNSLKDGVIRDANVFAEEQGKIAIPISTKEHPVGILGDWASFEYQFRVVDAPRANVIIEKADVVIQKSENISADNRGKDETEKQPDLSTDMAVRSFGRSNELAQTVTSSAGGAESVAPNKSVASVSLAMDEFRKKAEAGDADAQCRLGNCYYYGMDCKQDSSEAVKWFRKAAEHENADAQFKLGLCYGTGDGVPQDRSEALKWDRKAAERGLAPAQTLVGAAYYDGQLVAKDDGEAVKWFRKAAEQGEAGGQLNLGHCYDRGQGVPQDYIEAYKWFNLAAAQNDADGARFRDHVAQSMTREQIAEGQRRASEFVAQREGAKATSQPDK